jgi:hypothetical protein
MEAAYMQGQINYAQGRISFVQTHNEFLWVETPWNKMSLKPRHKLLSDYPDKNTIPHMSSRKSEKE